VAMVFAGLSLDIYAKYAHHGHAHGKHKHAAEKAPAVPLTNVDAKHK